MAEEGSGFTPEDRKLLIRSEVKLEHIGDLLESVTERTVVLEKGHVTREELRAVEIDIDTLRMDKADKAELRGLDLRKLNVSEFGKEEIKELDSNHKALQKYVEENNKALRKDIEDLIRQRWFERGIVVAATALGELILHVVFNK
jgi:hypothetical protein